MTDFGVTSMATTLERVALRRPGAILTADATEWHYAKALDPAALTDQYDTFVGLIQDAGPEILWLDDQADDLADSVFTYDPSFMLADGAVVLRPGKSLRAGEADLHERFYTDHNIAILGRIQAPGLIEGGDCFWLTDTSIAIGRGFRSNQSGIDQFSEIAARHGVSVEVFDLPYLHGPEACLHLMSLVSPLDTNLALVHAPLMPTALFQRMQECGYELIVGPPEEFEASLGLNLNVLALGPRKLIAIDGFPKTVALIRDAGCDVTVFQADELCIPCEGGPTCLTRPIKRA